LLTWKRFFLLAIVGVALAASVRAQTWGVGATYGSVNNINHTFSFDGFKPSEVTGWVDYRMEKLTLLRFTYGSMWTAGSNSGQTVVTPGGPVVMPGYKDRINYLTIDVSYLFWEGFFTSGVFGGIGGYGINPQAVAPEFATFQDADQKAFGLNFGVDGEFRVMQSLAVVLRLTYHNIAADPRRQFFNADAGLVARF
jgi:hypothetical protein